MNDGILSPIAADQTKRQPQMILYQIKRLRRKIGKQKNPDLRNNLEQRLKALEAEMVV